jgi:hypothetical protein
MAYSNPANIFPPFPHLTIYSFFLASIAPRFPIREARECLFYAAPSNFFSEMTLLEFARQERFFADSGVPLAQW